MKLLNHEGTWWKNSTRVSLFLKVLWKLQRFVLKRVSKFSILFIANMEQRASFWLPAQFCEVVWLVVWVLKLQSSWSQIRLKFFVFIYRSFVLFQCDVALQHLTNPRLNRSLCLSACLPVFFFVLFVFCILFFSFHPPRLGWRSCLPSLHRLWRWR